MPHDDGWLLDILLAARRVAEYVKNVSENEFQRNQVLQDAVVKRLEIIGEAANQLSDSLKKSHSEVPWDLIVGMRHRLVHEYFHIDVSKVWDVAKNEVPKLIAQIEPLVPSEEDISKTTE